MSRLWKILFGLILSVFVVGCGVTVVEGTFDPDKIEIDEDLLLDVDEEILEEEEADDDDALVD